MILRINLAVVLISRLNKESQAFANSEPTARNEYIQALAAASVNASVRATGFQVVMWELVIALPFIARLLLLFRCGQSCVGAVLKVIELDRIIKSLG